MSVLPLLKITKSLQSAIPKFYNKSRKKSTSFASSALILTTLPTVNLKSSAGDNTPTVQNA